MSDSPYLRTLKNKITPLERISKPPLQCLCGSEHAQNRGILAEICPSLLATRLSPTRF